MTHFDHATHRESDPPVRAEELRPAAAGMALFVAYATSYAGFVLASAFAPQWMARRLWGGVNVAVWYGFGLLFGALLVALIYSWLCRARNAA